MFSDTPVYEVDGNIVFGMLLDPVVPDPTDTVYKVPSVGAGRLDEISNYFYGTPHLWWVIARVNEINDALVGPSVNDQLRIPTRDRLAALGILTA